MGVESADFSGWATKNDLRCSDGRTIRAGAFKHQDKMQVPLVWQHQHNDPDNVLGHAILEDRAFGTYAYGFFNESESGRQAKELVKHKDVNSMSIFANNLTEANKNVLHGDIKEVSLVLAGANPGALIEHVAMAHGDGTFEDVLTEAVVYTGLELEHSDIDIPGDEMAEKVKDEEQNLEHADTDLDEETVKDVFETFDEKQKKVLYFMVGEALEQGKADGTAKHDDFNSEDVIAHIDNKIQEGFNDMSRNLFETHGTAAVEDAKPTLSHDQLATIVADAQKLGSFKESMLSHAVEYGIENIDYLFPDAKTLSNSPEIISRRTEWVADVMSSTKHSPISRIKSVAADLTADEARAKGYVKGNLKKDEIIKLLKRVTTPTTVYKKQKLDRDDIIDITDLDVVAWLKAEMRMMLEEEIARAILIGDGRESDDDDKIDEDHIRPIATDDDMYAHKVTIQSNAGADTVIKSALRSRTYYKGTGTPTFYTTDSLLTDMVLLEDKVGRRKYETEAALAAALRVNKIVTVEVMEDMPDILGIIVNLADYTIGADKGGNISMFDDFDIDYNQFKYLIETRISGALTKPKGAVVLRRDAGTLVTPQSPSFDGATNTITIPTVAGVVYQIDGVTKTGDVVIEETTEVEAFPATGYSFPNNTNTSWTFVYVG